MNFSIQTSGEEGLGLVNKIKAINSSIPIILITGWATISLAVEGIKLGAKDFISKPWRNENLLQSIQTTLQLNQSKNIVLLYALNPLVIIEFCGNLHFEGILITFLLLTVALLIQQKWTLSAFPFAGAILVKLHPLMLLPFIIKYLGWKKGVIFTLIAGTLSISLFTPFLLPFSQWQIHLHNIISSLKLYVETFEFNGGIYYIFRWIGQWHYGYNPIHIVGKLLFVLNIVGLVVLFIKQQKGPAALIKSIAMIYMLYVLLSTTVHPWYILSILPFSLLVKWKTPLMWTGIIIVSYFAYSTNDWQENFYLLIIEYTFVFLFLFYECKRTKKLNENSI